ncbi:MAG: hypothetical protein NZ699_09325 [Roseiflexus sp.]|nr:hypothetical protein [Roseiflexus sp.]MCS7289315.1 hypothetical protein [Roseiflexus sp.]MDW8145044.1 hypothetical protein [Roseiflexaceae bacterium]MDW8231853.1 hypothetical protein [Roseiflexaceae bacterium]
MTTAELLSFLGLAWSRLLVFPGGACVLIAVWLAEAFERRRAQPALLFFPTSWLTSPLTASAVVLPWLGVALLPLPGATALSRPVDLVAVVGLLEWPRLLAITADLQRGDRTRGVQRLAAALNGYPPLVLSLLLMSLKTGTLEVAGLLRVPEIGAPLQHTAWFWLGAGALILALPPLIEVGPFALDTLDELRPGLRLRTLGFILIAALPGMALLTRDDAEDWWRIALPPLALGGALWVFHSSTRQQSALRWARIYAGLDLILLLALLAAGLLALQARLA